VSHPEHDNEPARLGAGPELREVLERMTVIELVDLAITLGVPAADLVSAVAAIADERTAGG
jgi:hypothetical protein